MEYIEVLISSMASNYFKKNCYSCIVMNYPIITIYTMYLLLLRGHWCSCETRADTNVMYIICNLKETSTGYMSYT